MSNIGARPQITNETPGPALALLAICSAATSALVAGGAVGYQLRARQTSIGQSVATFKAVYYGLGYQVTSLTTHDRTKLQQVGFNASRPVAFPSNQHGQYEYASNLLYIISLLFLKAVQFLLQFATTYPTPNYYVPGVIMMGMVAFLFAAAFECKSPFWDLRTAQCFNQVAFWLVFGVFDILSDIYSMSVVLKSSVGLQMKSMAKATLLAILLAKSLPTCCAIARLPFVQPAYSRSTHNWTIELYKLGMPTQLQLHLAVAALALGKIFRFLHALDVGYLSSAIEPRTGKGTKVSGYAFQKSGKNTIH